MGERRSHEERARGGEKQPRKKTTPYVVTDDSKSFGQRVWQLCRQPLWPHNCSRGGLIGESKRAALPRTLLAPRLSRTSPSPFLVSFCFSTKLHEHSSRMFFW